MKKSIFLFSLFWLHLLLAACGGQEEEAAYYEIRVESQSLEGAQEGQWLLGRQYYQGEPVCIIAEKTDDGGTAPAMDVYIKPDGKDSRLLFSGVSREYRSTQWYLDSEGNCFIPQTDGVIRLDGDGNMLYHSKTGGWVRDICGLEGGKVILLTEENKNYGLAELDPVTGAITKIDSVALGSGTQYIGASGKRLMLLDENGFWHVDLQKGARTLELPFGGSAYSFQSGILAADLWADGNEAGIIWSSGMEEQLARVNISEEREVIIVRVGSPERFGKWLKEQVNLFNRSNDTYYAVFESCGEETSLSDFCTETNLQIAAGKGADIIFGDALAGDIYSMIDNGIYADLTPLMETSGISEEDYFPAAFDAWKHGGKIYGVQLEPESAGFTMDKSLLGSGKELDIETFLDIMLNSGEKRILHSGWTESWIMEYLLSGSEDMWGMIDWEKGTCDFGGVLFSRMLRAAKQCAYKQQYDYPEIMDWRKVYYFYNYETEREMESKNRMMAGLMFDDGCHAVFRDNYVMGINARSRHIEGAWELLAYLLGEEAQYARVENYDFPVNRNAFNRIAQEEIEAGALIEGTTVIDGTVVHLKPVKKGDEDLTQETVDDMIRYFDDARAVPLRTQPLISIILEETAAYFSGSKSEDEVIGILQNRVQLYLDEHKGWRPSGNPGKTE